MHANLVYDYRREVLVVGRPSAPEALKAAPTRRKYGGAHSQHRAFCATTTDLTNKRALMMSRGWMTQVAPIPETPPFRKGLTAFQVELSARLIDIVKRCKGEGGRREECGGMEMWE